MTFFKTALRGAAAAAIIAASASFAMAQEVTLKLHQFLPPQANVPKLVLDILADKIEADSEGRIKIERYPSMHLGGKLSELMDQVTDGIADIVLAVNGFTPGRFPRTEVFELPFMVTDARAASSAYWQLFEAHMKDTDFQDVKILGTFAHGPGMLHTKNPIATPADLNGQNIRGGSRLVNQLLEKLGGCPWACP